MPVKLHERLDEDGQSDKSSQSSPTPVGILLVNEDWGLLLVQRRAAGLRDVGQWNCVKHVVVIVFLIVGILELDKTGEIATARFIQNSDQKDDKENLLVADIIVDGLGFGQ